MSKAQTDIRTTSYDVWAARPDGYQGDLDSVLAQIRAEPDTQHQGPRGRDELLMFLGVRPADVDQDARIMAAVLDVPVPADDSVEYFGVDADSRSKYSLEYAKERWPESFLPVNWGLPS